MGEHTNIEWCSHTFSPWRGCTKVSPGCTHCYAETLAARFPGTLGRFPGTLGVWGDKGTRVIASESYWRQPLRWNRAAQKAGERRRVFCASLADVFEDRAELVESRARLFKLILATPHLDWLLLSKRPENFDRLWRMAHEHARPWSNEFPRWPRNVWLGVSVEDQQRADERIPLLLQVPAAVRFLSCEPLLGPVTIYSGGCPYPDQTPRGVIFAAGDRVLDWVIVGGESGPGARPMHPEWARGIRDQCKAAGVPMLFKQWGEWALRDDALVDADPDCKKWRSIRLGENGGNGHMLGEAEGEEVYMQRVGKARAGRLLDGRLHDEYPRPREGGAS